MKPAKIIPVLFIATVFLTGFWFYRRPTPDINASQPNPSPTPAILQTTTIIDYGNGQKSTHIRQFVASESAFALLRSVTTEQRVPITFKEYPFGTIVDSINQFKNSPARAWVYFINSRSPEVGADKYQLRPGDIIEWKYIKPNE